MIKFTFQYIKNLASPGVWRRGYDYYQKNQVEKVELNEEGIVGKVKGNFRDEYTTLLKFSETEVKPNCDCPFPDEWCKHAVAVALIGISRGLWNKFWGIEDQSEEQEVESDASYEGKYCFIFNEKSKPKTVSIKIISREDNVIITLIEPILRAVIEAQKLNTIQLTDKEKKEFLLLSFLHKYGQLDKHLQHFYVYFDHINELMTHLTNVEDLRHAETKYKIKIETNPLKLIMNINLSIVGNVLVALHWKRSNPEDIIPYEEIKLFAKRIQWGVYKNTIFPIETKVGELPYFLSKSSFLDIKGGDSGRFLFEQLPKFKEGLQGEMELEEADLIKQARLEHLKPKKVLTLEMPDEYTLRVALEFNYDGVKVPYSDTAGESPYVCVAKGAPPPKQYSIEEFREQEAVKRKADIEAGLIDPAKTEKKMVKVIRVKVLNKGKAGFKHHKDTLPAAKLKEPTSVQSIETETDLQETVAFNTETIPVVLFNEDNYEEYQDFDDIDTTNNDRAEAEPNNESIILPEYAESKEYISETLDKQEILASKDIPKSEVLDNVTHNILLQESIQKPTSKPKKHTFIDELDLVDKIFQGLDVVPTIKPSKATKAVDTETKSNKIPKGTKGKPPKKMRKDVDSIEEFISVDSDFEDNLSTQVDETVQSDEEVILQEPKDIFWTKRDIALEKSTYKSLIELGLTPMQTNKLEALKDSLVDFIGKHLPVLLKDDEWEVIYPEEIERIRIATEPFRFKIKIDFAETLDSFFLEVLSTVGKREINLDKIQELVKEGRKYVYASGIGYAEIPIGELLQLTKTLNSFDANKITESKFRAHTFKVGLIAELYDQNIDIEMSEEFKKFWDLITSFSNFEEIPLSANITATLREYQQKGFSWLYFLYTYGLNGILADDMGLGKTLQALTLLQKAKDEHGQKPTLVVCPTSVVFNWEEEIQKFAPTLRAINFTGSGRHVLLNKFNSHDVIITSYALLRRDINYLKKYHFRYIILDESQKIKNYQSLTANVSKQLHSTHRLALSGTPIENRLAELWSVFDFLTPGFLYDYNEFRYRYAQPIEDHNNKDAERRLKKQVFPFILRRLKQNVAKDLPDKLEFVSYCELLPEQQNIYLDILDKTREEIFRKIERDGIAKSQLSILSALLRLRQICCHPQLIGDVHDATLRNSGKFEHLKGMIKEVIDQDHRVLLFSQFVEMLKIIREWLEEDKIKFEYLTGSTVNRKECVDRFNNDDSIPVFLISLKAGGTGLNLTGADYVIHYDPWWNPAVEDQATDRAHRIGQTKKVFVYKLITKGTVEEKMVKLQEKKRDLIDSVITVDTSLGKILTYEDLKDILTPDF